MGARSLAQITHFIISGRVISPHVRRAPPDPDLRNLTLQRDLAASEEKLPLLHLLGRSAGSKMTFEEICAQAGSLVPEERGRQG